MSDVTDTAPEAVPPAAVEAEKIASTLQGVRIVTADGAEAATPPPAEANDGSLASAANEAGPAPGPGRGRGRGRGRGVQANKRGGASRPAPTSTSTGAGRGRGKRKSEAAALAHDAGIDATTSNAGEEPRKRRKAAQRSRRTIDESTDEDNVDTDHAKQVDQPAATMQAATDSQQALEMEANQGNEAVADTGTGQRNKSPQPAKRSLKVKLALKRDSQDGSSPTESPVKFTSPASAPVPSTAHVSDVLNTTYEGQHESGLVGESAKPAARSDASKNEAPLALTNLFDDSESQQNVKMADASEEQVPNALTATASSESLKIETDSAANPAKPVSAAAPSSSQASKSPASTSLPKTDPTAKKKSTPGLKAPGSKGAAGMTGSGPSTSASSGPPRKRVLKSAVSASTTPKASSSTPARAVQPETSFLDALFADTIPQTEHERQLQREREERSKKELAAKAKKAKDDGDARRKALAASNAANKPSIAGLVPAGGKPPPVALSSIKSANAPRTAGTSVLSRLGGSEKMRQVEIDKLRAESRLQQEKLAEEGGFDLLSQGIEMAAFETPFLREWRSHQGMIYSGAREGKPFQYYRGAPPKSDEHDMRPQIKPLPHPWTFGSAFAFAGSKPEGEPWK